MAVGEKIKIVDISKWQGGQIDWDELARNTTGVIIRATYGTTVDPYFSAHYAEASARGLQVGAYGYATWRGKSPEARDNAEEEANALIVATAGKELSLGIWYDIEYEDSITCNGPGVITEAAVAAVDVIRRHRPDDIVGLYGSLAFFARNYIRSMILDIPKWIAAYGSKKYEAQVLAWDPYIWQYSGSGNLPGCAVKIDLNYLWPDKFPVYNPAALADLERKKYLARIEDDLRYYADKYPFGLMEIDDTYDPTPEEAAAEAVFEALMHLHHLISPPGSISHKIREIGLTKQEVRAIDELDALFGP